MNNILTVNELFSGIGSQHKALDLLGIPHKIVGIAEIDKFAIQSYEAMFGKTKNYGDISKAEKLDYADFWTYSFPCQDISSAGKQRKGIIKNETRSGLLYEVERLLETSKKNNELPKYLLMENVKNLIGVEFIDKFKEWLDYLNNLGYNNYWQVLNAKYFEVPQNRERVFAVSIRKDLDDNTFVFPTGFDSGIRLKDVLEDNVENEYVTDFIQNRFKPNENLKEGGNYIQILGTTSGGGTHSFHNVLGIDGVSPTLRARDYQGALKIIRPNSNKISKLTTREYWRLTGFTDNDYNKVKWYSQEEVELILKENPSFFNKKQILQFENEKRIDRVPKGELYKQAGNSIVVNVLYRIFERLFNIKTNDGSNYIQSKNLFLVAKEIKETQKIDR